MSAQPVPIDKREELLAAKKRAEKRSDILYIAGAAAIALGLGGIRWYLAPIAVGCFAMLIPLLELITGFIRGLRTAARQR